MRSFLLLATLLVAASAFAPPARHGLIMTRINMFSPNPDEVATPLEVVVDGESASVPVVEAASFPEGGRTMLVKNLAKGGEVKKGESNVSSEFDHKPWTVLVSCNSSCPRFRNAHPLRVSQSTFTTRPWQQTRILCKWNGGPSKY